MTKHGSEEHPGRPRVLLLTADTGGGHRAAADAVQQALHHQHPGQFVTVTCDPLTGAEAHRVVRWPCRRYGPLVRVAPWLWALLFHSTNTAASVGILRRLLTRYVSPSIAAALARHRPRAVVVLHPLLVTPAVTARRDVLPWSTLWTVITDLGTAHRSWWHPAVDQTVAPSADLLDRGRRLSGMTSARGDAAGIPVREQFRTGPISPTARAALRVCLGIGPDRFVVLVTAGAEGARGMRAWARAIVTGVVDVDVVAVCGRNARLRADLNHLAGRGGRQLVVTGFVENMADWMRCADVLVTKAGPGIIAEATACGVPMLLAGHLPGQEAGNTEIVVDAGAGRRIRGRRQLRAQIEDLRSNPVTLNRMRVAATRLGRPNAGSAIADLLTAQLGTCRVNRNQPI